MIKVLITGASGYIGARIYTDLRSNPSYEVMGTYFRNQLTPDLVQLDITSVAEVTRKLSELKPDIIIHTAAFSGQPRNPQQKRALEQVNFPGTKNIVDAANTIGAKTVFVSSAAALNPEELYGKSKAYGEKLCAQCTAGYLIVRPHTVFGLSPNTANDRSFNRILKNITDHTPAVYDTSWKFQPTYIGHISQITSLFIDGSIPSGLMSVAYPDLKSKYDLGHDILQHFNIPVTPRDEGSSRPTIELDLTEFQKLALSPTTYSDFIAQTASEIKGNIDSGVLE